MSCRRRRLRQQRILSTAACYTRLNRTLERRRSLGKWISESVTIGNRDSDNNHEIRLANKDVGHDRDSYFISSKLSFSSSAAPPARSLTTNARATVYLEKLVPEPLRVLPCPRCHVVEDVVVAHDLGNCIPFLCAQPLGGSCVGVAGTDIL